MNHTLSPQLADLREYAQHTRRELHKIPEYSGQEFKTSQYCRSQMEDFGYRVTSYEGFTGFIADKISTPHCLWLPSVPIWMALKWQI